METKKTSNKFSPEVRARAVRLVHEHQPDYPSQWMANQSVAAKIGYSRETLCNWVRQTERDRGEHPGLTTDERMRLKELERENRELRQANDILRKDAREYAVIPVSAHLSVYGCIQKSSIPSALLSDYILIFIKSCAAATLVFP